LRSFGRIACFVAAALLGGCATQPSALPPDYGSVRPGARLDPSKFDAKDLQASCSDMERMLDDNARERERIEAKIRSDHRGNQIIGYFSGFIPPLIVAANMNLAEKERYQVLYKRRDDLMALKRLRNCT
jgi:hypothetical protein